MYDKDILSEILLQDEFRTLNNDGEPYPPSAFVYIAISQEMQKRGSNISPKHVYVIVRENRNEYKDLLQQNFNIKPNRSSIVLNSNNSSVDSINTSSSSSAILHSKTFDIVISAEKWQTIKPIKKIYNNRAYWVLQSGWTDVIAERLWQQQKIECVFKFKKHNVHPNNESRYYVFFCGNCIECTAIIECTLLNIPPENIDVIMKCKLKNICYEKHANKKRQLKGKRRAIIANMLIKERKDAITFRREEAKRLTQFGDKSPPILPSSTVLRKAKEEKLLKQHGLIFSNPLLNLLNNAKCKVNIQIVLLVSVCYLSSACIGRLSNNFYTCRDIKEIRKLF